MKHLHSPRGGRLITYLAALLGTMSQTFAKDHPNGTLTVDHAVVRTGVRPNIGWQISHPEASSPASEPTGSATTRPILVRVTSKTLADLQTRDPMIRLVRPTEEETGNVKREQPSLIKQSTILHDGRNWTLVPNDAVIFLPAAMRTHVNAKPVGNLMPWKEFLAKNQSWLTTNEVTFDQAAGNDELPAERIAFWSKQDKVVVAVQNNGPISVRVESNNENLTKR